MQKLAVNLRERVFEATRHLETPLLVLDASQVTRNAENVRTAIPGVDLFYALKCNSHRAIVSELSSVGVGFEVASSNELRMLLVARVPAQRLMCLHTVKSAAFLRELHEAGVKVLAVDSAEEVKKVAQLAPRSQLVIRLELDGRGSRVRLEHKFGCSLDGAIELARLARRSGLEVVGVTMHVGSQCEQLAAWENALQLCRVVCTNLEAEGFIVRLMSLGGGLPAPYSKDVPSLAEIGRVIATSIPQRFGGSGCRVTIEPGRAIAASAGTLVTTVIGMAHREEWSWAYLDAGTYHGLFETLPAAGGFRLPIEVDSLGEPTRKYRLAGPTCDSLDTLPGVYDLPELRTGDRIAFRYAGAYSTSMATSFNGFEPPATVVLPFIDCTERCCA